MIEPDSPDLVCQLDNVQGMVDALTCVGWKRHQDALVELSEHGIVLIVEESGRLQAKVYLQRELFLKYEYGAQGRPKFGISLGLLVDCLNTFSSPGHSNTIEIKYLGPDMELLLKSVDTLNACIYSEIRTRIPETVTWDCNFEQARSAPLTFTVKVNKVWCLVMLFNFNVYFELSSVMNVSVISAEAFKRILLVLLSEEKDTETYRYKYKFLKATTANIPGNVVRENRGSKLTIGRGGMLKVQHLVSIAKAIALQVESAGYQPPSRIAYIEFFVKPEEPAD